MSLLNNTYKSYFNNYKKVIILGKGPTFKVPDKKDDDTFIICINDTLNFTKYYDMLIVNDVVTWDRLDNDKIKNLKYILTPLNPHFDCKPQPKKYNKNWTIKKLKNKGFNGKIILYNLLTTPVNNSYITLKSKISGSNNGVDFVIDYFENLESITTYGIGILGGDKYNKIFKKTDGFNLYSSEYLSRINNHIVNECKKNSIKLHLN